MSLRDILLNYHQILPPVDAPLALRPWTGISGERLALRGLL